MFTFTVQSVKIFLYAPHLLIQQSYSLAAMSDEVCGVIYTL